MCLEFSPVYTLCSVKSPSIFNSASSILDCGLDTQKFELNPTQNFWYDHPLQVDFSKTSAF